MGGKRERLKRGKRGKREGLKRGKRETLREIVSFLFLPAHWPTQCYPQGPNSPAVTTTEKR